MRVLVTGATGFVGRRVVAALLGRGHTVRIATRSPISKPAEIPAGVAVTSVGDIGPDTDWTPAFDPAGGQVDAVIHLVARVHVMRDTAADPLAAFRRVNTAGTTRLATAAAAAGVRRLLFVSSVKAVCDESRPEPLDAATVPAPSSPYGISKLEAEQALAAIAAQTGMETIILRPPLVYGPGVAGNFRALLRLVAAGVPLPLAGVDNRRSLVFVDNLADAIVRGVEHPHAASGTFFIHDGTPLSTPALIRALAAGMNRPARLLPCPPGLLRLAAGLIGRMPAYDRVAGSLTVDDGPLRRHLDWTPPHDAATALATTAAVFSGEHSSL